MRLPDVPPTVRSTPEGVARDLAALNGRLRLHHAGGNAWWLLWYNPHPIRQAVGRARAFMLGGELARHANFPALRQARLAEAGYQLWGSYLFDGIIPTQFLLDQARIKLAATEAEIERAFERAEYLSDSEGRRTDALAARLKERAHADKTTVMAMEAGRAWSYARA